MTGRGTLLTTCITLLLVQIAAWAWAGGSGERKLTLNEAVLAALEGNHALRAEASSVEAASEDIGIARSALLPKITIEERYMRSSNPTAVFSAKLNQERFTSADFAIDSLNHPDPVNDFQTSIHVEQAIFIRQAGIGLRMARKEYAAEKVALERTRESVAFDVVKTYMGVQAATGFIDVTTKGVEDAKEHLRIAQLRYDNGLGLYSDVLRATTSLKAAEQRLVSAKKNLEVSKRALGILIGTGEPVDISDNDTTLPLRELPHYLESSTTRNDVRSLKIKVDNARNSVRLAQADYYPTLGVGGIYQLNDENTPFSGEGDSWTVSAFLRWNFFDGALRKHNTAKARYKALEATERLEGLKKTVSFRVHEAFLAVEEARKNSELAQAALRSAEEGERLVRARFENSLSPIVDLLDAELALNQARVSHVVKKTEYLIAVAALSYEGGTILRDLNVE